MEKTTMKKLWIVFAGMAVLLSDVMCAFIAYSYCNMEWSNRYYLTSAPSSVVFLFAVPFLIGIAICVILSFWFYKKDKYM